jgi:hypothetical protein
MLSRTEKALEIIMMRSLTSTPYHIHKLSPASSTHRVRIETFSASRSFRIFMSWGAIETALKILAKMPTNCIFILIPDIRFPAAL